MLLFAAVSPMCLMADQKVKKNGGKGGIISGYPNIES
jgi:hypothetical protein